MSGCGQRALAVSPDEALARPGMPLATATAAERARFAAGDNLFELVFREPDGLGPLYIRSSCEGCHRADGRGPGLVTKMALIDGGGVAALPFGDTVRPYLTAGARHGIEAPASPVRVRVTHRLPPPVIGRGYLEAVADGEIERLAAIALARRARAAASTTGAAASASPAGSIGGRIHRLPDGRIGRFGLKAKLATLDEFTAEALQGDMGLTSPLRPHEPSNPDGLLDDAKPGIDIDGDALGALVDYLRLLEIPARRTTRAVPEAPDAPDPADASAEGAALFAEALCATCHVPSLRTRADYPVAALADVDAAVYTDFLLHDMGTALSDGVADGAASAGEWRTAPLIGLRFSRAFLHDGRAATVTAAVEAHDGPGSDAAPAVMRFRALPVQARRELVRFVEGL